MSCETLPPEFDPTPGQIDINGLYTLKLSYRVGK